MSSIDQVFELLGFNPGILRDQNFKTELMEDFHNTAARQTGEKKHSVSGSPAHLSANQKRMLT